MHPVEIPDAITFADATSLQSAMVLGGGRPLSNGVDKAANGLARCSGRGHLSRPGCCVTGLVPAPGPARDGRLGADGGWARQVVHGFDL